MFPHKPNGKLVKYIFEGTMTKCKIVSVHTPNGPEMICQDGHITPSTRKIVRIHTLVCRLYLVSAS